MIVPHLIPVSEGVVWDPPPPAGRGGTECLYTSCYDGLVNEARRALERGADVNATYGEQGLTALAVAVGRGHRKIVEVLVSYGAGVNQTTGNGDTALCGAVRRDDAGLVEMLIDSGARLDQAGANGFTPLILAAQNGYSKTLLLLLSAGAGVDQRGVSGLTPLFAACGAEQTEIASALIDAGADVNAATGSGFTPLSLLAHGRDSRLLSTVVNAGADLNHQDKNGATALIYAAALGTAHHVQLLLKAGADWTLRDGEGSDAVASARENENGDAAASIELWSERAVSCRVTMLTLARRAAVQTCSSGGWESLGDLAGLPADVLRRIALSVYVPAAAWLAALPQIDWRWHAISSRSVTLQLRIDATIASRKAQKLERATAAARMETRRLRGEVNRLRALTGEGGTGFTCTGAPLHRASLA